jgi:hypothetical protein
MAATVCTSLTKNATFVTQTKLPSGTHNMSRATRHVCIPNICGPVVGRNPCLKHKGQPETKYFTYNQNKQRGQNCVSPPGGTNITCIYFLCRERWGGTFSNLVLRTIIIFCKMKLTCGVWALQLQSATISHFNCACTPEELLGRNSSTSGLERR